MLQNNKPFRRTYYNGERYAIRPIGNDMLYFCDDLGGKITETMYFSRRSRAYTIEAYLAQNGYKEV